MKVILKNLGVLESAKYELGDLTVVCGKNNTGKTLAAYTLYGFLDYWRNKYDFRLDSMLVKEIKRKQEVRIARKQIQPLFSKNLELAYKKYVTDYLPKVLGMPPEQLRDCSFRLDIRWIHSQSLFMKSKTFRWIPPEHGSYIIKTDNEGKNVRIFQEKEYIPQEFLVDSVQNLANFTSSEIIPCVSMTNADRIDAGLFSEEIGYIRNNRYQQNNLVFQPLIKDLLSAENGFNTENYLNMIRDFLQKPLLEKTELQIIFDKLLNGSFEFRHHKLHFTPFRTGNLPLSLGESSSSVRSLLPIWLQLYSCTSLRETPITMFMIDEPEMNLHPANQRILARIFARLVNQGYKVYITTHSDYIVKELNTLIMLHQRNRNNNRVMKRYGYSEEEILDPAKVRVYTTQQVPFSKTEIKTRTKTKVKKTITDLAFPKYIFVQAKIDELGIYLPTFDETINEMNTIQDEILAGG